MSWFSLNCFWYHNYEGFTESEVMKTYTYISRGLVFISDPCCIIFCVHYEEGVKYSSMCGLLPLHNLKKIQFISSCARLGTTAEKWKTWLAETMGPNLSSTRDGGWRLGKVCNDVWGHWFWKILTQQSLCHLHFFNRILAPKHAL